MLSSINWTKVLDKGAEKAEQIFSAGTRERSGKLEVRAFDIDGNAGQMMILERPFVQKAPASDEVLNGKFIYSIRTGKDSGAPESEVREGEAPWRGAVWAKGIEHKVLFGFTGLTEEEDVEVAEAMEAELKRQLAE